MRRAITGLLLICLLCGLAWAQDGQAGAITIATWNVGLVDRSISDLDLREFGNEVNPDILVLNEVKTIDDIRAIRAALDREEDAIAISSFESGNGNPEVGILSRFPITDVVEFDRSLESNQVTPTEKRLERVHLAGIADVDVGRGFLVVHIPSKNLFIIGTHLKSSRGDTGQPDRRNAQKREFVAAAIAEHVNDLREDSPQATIFVLGDFNVGVTDTNKNGTDLTVDTFSGSGDKYDETHALLKNGLVDDLRMRSLVEGLDGTLVGDDNVPDFPGSGAIDVIYVIGSGADRFQPAKRASNSFGSDHLAVYTRSEPTSPGTRAGSPNVVIRRMLPNPEGEDAGHETITLENTGAPLRVTGWKFRDAAGNLFLIPADTEIVGTTVIPLTENTMPLNNKGDTIVLLDDQGTQVGPAFSYTKQDVKSGDEVVH